MSDLLDKRLLFVTGKGGVGKSTVAVALGLLAAARGRRVIVAELAGQEHMRRSMGGAAVGESERFEEVELGERLYSISIDPQDAMEEYFRVRTGALGQSLGSSRVFQTFAMATPGMRELLSIGKVWELSQPERRTEGAAPYDLVIVDAPATGHGVGILRTPSTFAGIARVGPIAAQAGTIAATLADRAFTGVIAVATPEEMPVNETIALEASLQDADMPLDLVVLNQFYPRRFSPPEVESMRRALPEPGTPEAAGALRAALSQAARARLHASQRRRLTRGIDAPVIDLPFLFVGSLGPPELTLLAERLGERLPTAAPGATSRHQGEARPAREGAR